MRVSARLLSVLAVGCALRGANPDEAIVTAMRSAAGINDVRVLRRIGVDTDLDLVLAAGFSGPTASGSSPRAWQWWGKDTPLGLFLQRREQAGMVYRLAIDKGLPDMDCSARLERVTSAEVVLSCTPEKGRFGPMRKFVYDSRAKTLVKQFDYSPYQMARIFVSGERAILVGSNYRELVALEYDPARTPAFRVLRGGEKAAWEARLTTTAGTVGLEMRREIYIQPEPSGEIRFGRGRRFAMKDGLITQKAARGAMDYPLPQSSYDEFARARPERVRDGYRRDGTTIEEKIGPWQVEGDRLWFGKTFYDGEGNTGVGGFGYFDSSEKKYKIYSPREIAGWSVAAILVEPDTIWLGLIGNGEYRDCAGGLMAFDRKTQQIERFDLPDVVASIARAGEHLVIATAFGPAVLDNGRLGRFFVDKTSDGRLYVAEAAASFASR